MSKKRGILLVIAILLTGCCLRAPFTGTGSIIRMIQADLDLGSAGAGMLTSIPLLTFGVCSVFIGVASRKLGTGRIMVAGALLVSLGILLRSLTGLTGLFAGTVVLGMGMCVGNVQLPAIVKEYFPGKQNLMTSTYTTIMSLASGVSGGVSVPLAMRYGWRVALLVWAGLSLASLLLWFGFRRIRLASERELSDEPGKQTSMGQVLHSPLAWKVGLYFGLQSVVFYTFVAWFASILQSRGVSMETAGFYNSLYLFMGLSGSFTAPLLAGIRPNKSWLGTFLGLVYAGGMLIMILGEGTLSIWLVILICGYCQGACFSYVMLMFVFHTENAEDSALMSGFGQSIAYLIASVGPTLIGRFYDITGDWLPSLWFLFGICIVLVFLGRDIGRPSILGTER